MLTSTLSSTVDHIEEEANSYFQKIYDGKISLNQLIETLKKFKNSDSKHKREVYVCIIHNLFDEYRFFHKYPMKELKITSVLFGLLIHHELMSLFCMDIALRYVLEALRKTEGSKMFKFGMWALEEFKDMLDQFPEFLKLIIELPHLKQNYQCLIVELEIIAEKTKDASPTAEEDDKPMKNTVSKAIRESPLEQEPNTGSWGTASI